MSGRNLISTSIAVALLVLVSGCLFKPPAQVSFYVDSTSVPPGGTFHIIVTVNNTGKVGLIGATLILNNEEFQILQEPQFPQILKVGQVVQLVWVVLAPQKSGVYPLQASLELKDELKRTWKGFYYQFRIMVTSKNIAGEGIKIKVDSPQEVVGGNEFDVQVRITNNYRDPVTVNNVSFVLLNGIALVESPKLPQAVPPGDSLVLRYRFLAPYAFRSGLISVVVDYQIGMRNAERSHKTDVASFKIVTIWQPWSATPDKLKAAYGQYYSLIHEERLVDGYWELSFNSSSSFDPVSLSKVALPIVNGSVSEYGASSKLMAWLSLRYNLTSNTSTLSPEEMIGKGSLSVPEEQLLMTALLRSINIPSRVVSLFNGSDCTIMPLSEFYTEDGWYIIDVKHGFVGTLDEYLASPYFPRIYQLITRDGYSVVAQVPSKKGTHGHIDITDDFTSNAEPRIMDVLVKRVQPNLRSKLDLVFTGLSPEERIYGLFILSSAPDDESLNNVLGTWSTERIQKTIKAMYDFYKNVPWKEDFRYYWKIFTGEVG
ncbi:transglutaminase domain-containing protein [Thermococcus stetteri]|uniref:transglutaminase domain-containing protein n=1 Tax=Thermococcus stetteri TaxID=49900 RepID=UPI001AE8C9C5|nr:transglutaminase domain-containing protein [Thermococcus stetteri]MBP1910956.1 hypothetical protein [Thermococcus stetteri]